MQPLMGKTTEKNPNVLFLMHLWNDQPFLKHFRTDPRRKNFKRIEKLLIIILTKGFMHSDINRTWVNKNNISADLIKKPISVKLLEKTIVHAGKACINQKHRRLKTLSMGDFLLHELDQSSYFLLLVNTEVQTSIYDRMFQEVLKSKLNVRKETIAYWKEVGTEKDVREVEELNPISKYEEETHALIKQYENMGWRSLNLIQGLDECAIWHSEEQFAELHQIIYDLYVKLDITGIVNPEKYLETIVKKYFECIYYLAEYEPDPTFKIAYLKVGGKGTWATFVYYERKNNNIQIKLKQ